MTIGQMEATVPQRASLAGEEHPPDAILYQWSDRELLRHFTRERDEAAFRVVVERYGSLVLGVCRRVLRHDQDVEDAFQATFLVLARKAWSLEQPERLKNWLYGVAYRVARKAKAQKARRAEHECQAGPGLDPAGGPDPARLEARRILDEEVARLPRKYRDPLVLCYLEGNTHEETARQLGCPLGSVSWLLGQATRQLRQRLHERGLTCASTLAAPVLLVLSRSADVPVWLLQGAARAAFLLVASTPALGLVQLAASRASEAAPAAGQAAKKGSLGKLLGLGLAGGLILAALLWDGQDTASPAAPPPAPTASAPTASAVPPPGACCSIAIE